MLKWYIRYCIFAAVMSVVIAVVVWDVIIADEEWILIPGYIAPAEQPVTT